MSNNVLSQAPFIPQHPPKAAILDLSGRLSPDDLANLQSLADGLRYKAKVVVLPGNFTIPSPQEFMPALARQWDVVGSRLLIVVDLKGHSVKAVPGASLKEHGITGDYISHRLLPHEFIPYIKTGDLKGAIAHTLSGVDKALSMQKIESIGGQIPVATGTLSENRPQNVVAHGSMSGWFTSGLVLLAVLVTLFFINRNQANKNRKLLSTYNDRLGNLYQAADEIGQASEYLDPKATPELAQRVADFFNQVTVLDKAKSEFDSLQRQNKVYKAEDGLLKCLRLVDKLLPESQDLLNEVNGVTGGIKKPVASTDSLKTASADDRPLPMPVLDSDRFRRPGWSMEPAYAPPPVMMSPGFGFMNLMFLVGEMNMNRRLDQIEFNQMHQDGAFGGGYDAGQASWDDRSSSSSWSDNGDPGAGFDVGSADWGGDAGGGDFGGGGDGSW